MVKLYSLLKKGISLRMLSFLLLPLAYNNAFSQNVGINASGNAPHSSAGLDVSFTDKGLLIPNVALTSTADVSTITSPATSLLIYNTANTGDVTPGYYYYSGSAWIRLATGSGGGSQWTTNGSNIHYNSGNVGIGVTSPTYKLQVGAISNPLFLSGVQAGTSSDSVLTILNGLVKKLPQNELSTNSWSLGGNSLTGTDFIGSTNSSPLYFKTNNTQRAYIDENGNMALGGTLGTSNKEKFLVDAGVTTSYNGLTVKGTINKYFQLSIQNKSSGNSASTDIVATANNGSETTNYVDLGINGGGNSADYYGGQNDSYLYSVGGDLIIGTASASKNLVFLTAGGHEQNNQRMIITASGLVGIGTGISGPTNKLTVSASSNPLALVGLQTGTVTDSLLSLNNKVVKRIANTTWNQVGNSVSTEPKLGTTSNFALPFITNNTEKMRLTSAGTLSIASDSPNEAYKFFVNGDAIATSWATSSDKRLKKNVQALNYGLQSILNLIPVSYNWIDPSQSTKTQLGLIAQDTRKVIPEIVNGDESKEKLSINYTELIPVLINAIKEQQTKIDAQQKEIDELKALIKK